MTTKRLGLYSELHSIFQRGTRILSHVSDPTERPFIHCCYDHKLEELHNGATEQAQKLETLSEKLSPQERNMDNIYSVA